MQENEKSSYLQSTNRKDPFGYQEKKNQKYIAILKQGMGSCSQSRESLQTSHFKS